MRLTATGVGASSRLSTTSAGLENGVDATAEVCQRPSSLLSTICDECVGRSVEVARRKLTGYHLASALYA